MFPRTMVGYDTLGRMGDRRLREGLMDPGVLGKAYGGCALKAITETGHRFSTWGWRYCEKNQHRSGWVGHSGSLRNSVQIDIDLPS